MDFQMPVMGNYFTFMTIFKDGITAAKKINLLIQ